MPENDATALTIWIRVRYVFQARLKLFVMPMKTLGDFVCVNFAY